MINHARSYTFQCIKQNNPNGDSPKEQYPSERRLQSLMTQVIGEDDRLSMEEMMSARRVIAIFDTYEALDDQCIPWAEDVVKAGGGIMVLNRVRSMTPAKQWTNSALLYSSYLHGNYISIIAPISL